MFEWLKDILGDAYSGETDKRVSRKNGKNFVLHSDFNIIFFEKVFSIVDDSTSNHSKKTDVCLTGCRKYGMLNKVLINIILLLTIRKEVLK